jgi:hypothetical protein
MRARARIALVLMVLSASFGLAGCAAIDELKEAFLRWVESEKLSSGPRGGDGQVIGKPLRFRQRNRRKWRPASH